MDDTQFFVAGVDDVSTGVITGSNIIGAGSYDPTSEEVAFPMQQHVTTTETGMLAIWGQSAAVPTWSTEALISSAEMTASGDGLDVQDDADGFNGNGASFYDQDGALVVIWGAAWNKFGYSKKQSDGTWTAPGYLNYIPTNSGNFPTVLSLSVAVGPNGTASAYGLADFTTDWLYFEQLVVPPDSTLSGGAPPPVGVAF